MVGNHFVPHGMTDEEIDSFRKRFGKGPHVAADLALVSLRSCNSGVELVVLLVERGHPPHKGLSAIPGGFVEIDEDLELAARRELREETGIGDLGDAYVEQIQTYGDPQRDPRARVITVTFAALAPWARLPVPHGGDDAALARFFKFEGARAVDENGRPVPMAFDHDRALSALRDRLRLAACHSSMPLLLLTDTFTMDEARIAYETVLERKLDPDPFRLWIEQQEWTLPCGVYSGDADPTCATRRMRVRKPTWAGPMG